MVPLTREGRKAREEFIALISKYKKPQESDVLEVGMGRGYFGSIVGDIFKTYSGIDNTIDNLEICNRKHSGAFDYRLGLAEAIPFGDNIFDILLYPRVFHYIELKDQAIREAKRVIKPQGLVVVIEPNPDYKGHIWVDPRMQEGSPSFEPKRLSDKLDKIRASMDYVRKQRVFKVLEEIPIFDNNMVASFLIN
jgi:ubiquinone/menaquinone biosynthesis C-methylase UbiE